MAERVANDSSRSAGDRAHGDGDQGGRADIRGLHRPGDRDQRQAERIEPQKRPVA